MHASAKPPRRVLHYDSFADVVSDAEELSKQTVQTAGNWSFGQIMQHLAATANCSFDGYGFRSSWLVRRIIAPLIKNSLLTKHMRAGFRLPRKAASLFPEEVSIEAGLEALQSALTRYEQETPSAEHPALGRLAPQEWTSLGLRHAELHMSFVVPAGS